MVALSEVTLDKAGVEVNALGELRHIFIRNGHQRRAFPHNPQARKRSATE
jgi:hypothetical protein